MNSILMNFNKKLNARKCLMLNDIFNQRTKCYRKVKWNYSMFQNSKLDNWNEHCNYFLFECITQKVYYYIK